LLLDKLNQNTKNIGFLPLFAVCFVLGICLVRLWHIPFFILFLGTSILVGLGFLSARRKTSDYLLLILGVFLGSLFLKNSYILPEQHIAQFTGSKSIEVRLKGTVSDYPTTGQNYTTFTLAAEELGYMNKLYHVVGRVKVKIFRRENIHYGHRLSLQGRLFKPYAGRDRGFAYRSYLNNQCIYSMLSVSKKAAIGYLGSARMNPLKSAAYKIRNKAKEILFKNMPFTQAAVFSAMVLGDRSRILPYLGRLFIQTGSAHILAVSGLHVAIVGFLWEIILKALRFKRRSRYTMIMCILIFYCILTGARPSVIRATVMTIVFLGGFLLRRITKISHSLALAALIILFFNPRQLFNVGFQLSFTSVISIVYLSPLIRNLCMIAAKCIFKADIHKSSPDKRRFILKNICEHLRAICDNPGPKKVCKLLIGVFSVSLAAWIGVFPLIIYYFKIFVPVTVLANIVVVPYVSLVIALGFMLLIAGGLFPSAAGIFAAPANLSIVVLIKIIQFFNKLPFAYLYIK
jgi:competence protein ComEC